MPESGDYMMHEQIGFEVDLASFKQGLLGLRKEYKKFIKDCETEGVDVDKMVNVAGVASISQSLRVLVNEFRNLKKVAVEAWGADVEASNTAVSAHHKADAEISASTKKRAAEQDAIEEENLRKQQARLVRYIEMSKGATPQSRSKQNERLSELFGSYDPDSTKFSQMKPNEQGVWMRAIGQQDKETQKNWLNKVASVQDAKFYVSQMNALATSEMKDEEATALLNARLAEQSSLLRSATASMMQYDRATKEAATNVNAARNNANDVTYKYGQFSRPARQAQGVIGSRQEVLAATKETYESAQNLVKALEQGADAREIERLKKSWLRAKENQQNIVRDAEESQKRLDFVIAEHEEKRAAIVKVAAEKQDKALWDVRNRTMKARSQFDAQYMEDWDAALKENERRNKVSAQTASTNRFSGLDPQQQLAAFEQIKNGGRTAYEALTNAERKWFAETTSKLPRLKAQIKEVNAQLNGTAGGFQHFITRLTTDLPGLAAQALKYSLAFAVIGAAMSAIYGTLNSIKQGFKEGWEYLTKMEERASELREVMMDNAKFSNDPTENYKKATEAAVYLNRRLEELATKSHFKPDALQAGAQAFMETGGIKAVGGDIEKVAQDTTLFAEAMKAAGVNVGNQRRLITEISNAMSGNINKSSKWLEVTKYSKNEWDQMVKYAKAHEGYLKDGTSFHETLNKRLSVYVQKLDEADERHKEMNDMMDLAKQRYEALIAAPLWNIWLDLLKEAMGFFSEHQVEIKAIATGLGVVVRNTLQFVLALTRAVFTMPIIRDALKGVKIAFMAIVESINTILSGLTSVAHLASAFWDTISDPKNLANPKAAFKNLFSFAGQEAKKFGNEFVESSKRLSDVIYGDLNGAGLATGGVPQGVNHKATGTKDGNKGDDNTKDKLRALENEAQAAAAKVKEKYDEIRNATNELVANREISIREGSRRIIGAYQDERDGLTRVLEGLRKEGAKFLQGDKLSSFNSTIDKMESENAKRTNDAISKQRREQAKLDFELKKEELNAELKLVEQTNEQKKFLDQQAVESGSMLKSEAAQREIEYEQEAYNLKLALRKADLANAKENELERQKAESAIGELEREHLNWKVRQETEVLKLLRQQRKERLDQWLEAREQNVDATRKDYEQRKATGEISPELAQVADVEMAKITLDSVEQTIKDLDERLKAAVDKQSNMGGATQAEREAQAAYINELNEKIRAAIGKAADAQRQLDVALARNPLGRFFNAMSGAIKQWNDAQGATKKFSAALSGTVSVISAVKGVLQMFSEGGVAGGVGGIMSGLGGFMTKFSKGGVFDTAKLTESLSGSLGGLGKALGGGIGKIFGSLGSAAGPIGAALSFAGPLIGMFSGLFTRAARKIGEEIRKSVSDITKAYEHGDVSLVDTLEQLKAKRDEAVRRLTGKKGGQDELNKILPQLDDQIFNLQQKQKDLIQQMNDEIETLKNGDTLGSALKTWKDINKQVKDYLGASNEADKAQKALLYTNLQLQKLQKDSQKSLNEGEQEAIQDMIQLNDLLDQRVKLTEEWKQKEFEAANGDAIQTRQSAAVKHGQELKKQRDEYDKQLADIDRQISLETTKRNLYKEVFDLSQDINDLHRRDDELTLSALAEQIQKYKDLKTLISSITTDSAGNMHFDSSFGSSPLTQIYGGITIEVNGDGLDSEAIAQKVYDVFESEMGKYATGGSNFNI